METNTHPTKTYRGKPACAGSGTPYPVNSGNALCPVCGRSGFSTTATQKVGTHLHINDIARGTSTGPAPTQPTKTIEAVTMTPAQHDAIKNFTTDPSTETYEAMTATNPTDYARYAREQGF